MAVGGNDGSQDRKWPAVAGAGSPCDLWGLGDSSQSRQPGSFMKPHAGGNRHSQRGSAHRFAAFPPPWGSCVSLLGSNFPCGISGDTRWVVRWRHGSGTSCISEIPSSIFRCMLPCAYPPPPLHGLSVLLLCEQCPSLKTGDQNHQEMHDSEFTGSRIVP